MGEQADDSSASGRSYAGLGSSVPGESVTRVSRRGRGFKQPAFTPPSPPPVREPSPSPAPQPPRKEPPPSYLQLACVTAPPVLPPARMQQIATLPSHQAGSSRPGCWNCGRFGHSWVNCTLPRLRFCRMCGRLGCTNSAYTHTVIASRPVQEEKFQTELLHTVVARIGPLRIS